MSFSDKKETLYGSDLKLIAMITMLIDHIGAVLIKTLVVKEQTEGIGYIVYLFMRAVGRLSFPLYIFLLVEGLKHTKSRAKYLCRLCIFALISEIPYDLAFNLKKSEILNGKIIEFSRQNIFFTLFLGLLALIIIDNIRQREIGRVRFLIYSAFVTWIFLLLSYIISCDYDMVGIIAIVAAYAYWGNPVKEIFFTCIFLLLKSLFGIFAFGDIFIISYYNGQKGSDRKWAFYIFYPLHLMVLFACKEIPAFFV